MLSFHLPKCLSTVDRSEAIVSFVLPLNFSPKASNVGESFSDTRMVKIIFRRRGNLCLPIDSKTNPDKHLQVKVVAKTN